MAELFKMILALAELMQGKFGDAAKKLAKFAAKGSTPAGLEKLLQEIRNERARPAGKAVEPMSLGGGMADAASKEAERKRKELMDKWREKLKKMFGDLGQGSEGTKDELGTLGTFSASIAGMLGRSQPDNHAARTAEATEKSADLLEELVGKEAFLSLE